MILVALNLVALAVSAKDPDGTYIFLNSLKISFYDLENCKVDRLR